MEEAELGKKCVFSHCASWYLNLSFPAFKAVNTLVKCTKLLAEYLHHAQNAAFKEFKECEKLWGVAEAFMLMGAD